MRGCCKMLRELSTPGRASSWLARYPRHDESLSSFLDAVAQTFGIRRIALVRELSGGRARRGADLDAAEPTSLWLAAAERFGFSLEEILMRAVQEPYWLLPSYARTAYCPLCFERDLARQRTPYFRRAWSYGLVTMCLKHRTALSEWPARIDGQRILPQEWIISPSTRHTPRTAASYLAALNEAKLRRTEVLSKQMIVLEAFQRQCDEAGVTGNGALPASTGIERRQRIRHFLRKALGDLEPPCALRQGHLNFPDLPATRLPRRSRPLGRNGRIWAASKVAFRDLEWRRALLLPIAQEELEGIAVGPREVKTPGTL